MPFGPPLGGWFDASGYVHDSAVFDFGPRTDVPKSLVEAFSFTEGDLSNLAVVHGFIAGPSSDPRPTRNAHNRQMPYTKKNGDSGVIVAIWQNGSGGTPAGLVYSFSTDGQLWSVPVQITSRTNVYAVPILRPSTNDIYVFYEGILRGTAASTYVRVMAYTGTPGSPSWTVGIENGIDTSGDRSNYSADTDLSGFSRWIGERTDPNPDRIHERRMTLPFDPTTTTGGDQPNLVEGFEIWTDLVFVSSYAGSWLLTEQQGGQMRLFGANQIGNNFLNLVQLDTWFTDDNEEFSATYSTVSKQYCITRVNGSNIVYRMYNVTGDSTVAIAVNDTTLNDGTHACHSPLVQAHSDGTFYILWIEETAVANQRKVRCVNSAAPTTVFDLLTDSGSNVWHDLTGPRTTEADQTLKFMLSETADATNNVVLAVVPIPVVKTVSDAGTIAETMGLEVAFSDSVTGTDSEAQTYQVGSAFCQDQRTLLDQAMLDTANLDDPCVPFDTDERWTLTETINAGPEILDTITFDDELAITSVDFSETIATDDEVEVDQTVPDTVTVDDSGITNDQAPVGDQNDTGTLVDAITLEVLGDDSVMESVVFDVGILLDEPVTVDDQVDLQQDVQDDPVTLADLFAIEQTLDDPVAVDDVFVIEPVGADDTVLFVETLDVEIQVDDTVTGTDSDPSQNPAVSHDSPDTITFTDVATVLRNYGLAVRLAMVKGNVKLRAEGARTGPITVRNDPSG